MEGGAAFAQIGTTQTVASGGTASATWSGLGVGEYEWYATVGDVSLTTTGPDWTFTVQNAGAPVVGTHADVVAEATGPSGAVVTFTPPTATDDDPPNPVVTCLPASGATFALGDTTVTCSATDNGGNTGTSTFQVTVEDTTAPVVAVHAGMVVEATGPSGATVTFTAPPATDLVGPLSPAVTCLPASGATFALGDTTVTCSATDNGGNTGTSTFKVTVEDTTAPVVGIHPDMVVEVPEGVTSAVVDFIAPSASDLVGPPSPTVTCLPASGATFALGDTTVTCSATDTAGNTGTSTFKVTVTETAGPSPVLIAVDSAHLSVSGADHVAVLLSDPVAGAATVMTKRVSDGAELSTITIPGLTPVAMEVVPDLGGDPDLAILGLTSTGVARVYVRDSLSGASVGTASFGNVFHESLDLEVVGGDLAVLGTDVSDGEVRVQIRSTAGALVATVSFRKLFSGDDLEVVGGNLAVLGTRASDGAVRVQIRSTAGALEDMVAFGSVFSGEDLEVVGGNLAVLGTRASDGAVRVQVRSTAGVVLGTAHYQAAFSGDDLEMVGGNLAVLGTRDSDGMVRVQIRSTAGALVRTAYFGTSFSGDDLRAVGAEPGVLGTRESDGMVRVQISPAGDAPITIYYG